MVKREKIRGLIMGARKQSNGFGASCDLGLTKILM